MFFPLSSWGLYPLNKKDYKPHNIVCQQLEDKMFKFDRLFLTMDKKGVSTYRLREECGIDSKTVRRLRANQNIEMKTIDRICSFLDCKIEDVVEFIKD